MRKFSKVIAIAATMAILLTGCGASSSGKTEGTTAAKDGETTTAAVVADTSLEDIKANGKLVMGLDTSFPPMGFRDDKNEIVGYDIDLANEVTKRMGIELVLTPINWDSKDQELNNKNIDCIWNGFTASKDRLASMSCTSPYMKNTQVAVVLADSKVNTLADLAGKTVEIQKGSTASDALAENKEFTDSLKEVVKIADNVKALMDLGIGCDAVVMDEVVARYYTEKDHGKYRILEETLTSEDYVIGFRKTDVALSSEVEKILMEMVADGTMSKIDKKWFNKDVSALAN